MSVTQVLGKIRTLRRLREEKRQARAQRRSTDRPDLRGLPLLEFVPAINPRFERPEHLAPMAAELELASEQSCEVCCSAPPQHGKSELIFAAIARYMLRHPERRNAYASYSATIAERKSRLIREYCQRAGVQLDPSTQAADYWRTAQGGSLIATGVGGPLTSEGIDGLLVIDDPHKNRQEAESALRRHVVHDWLTSTAYSRKHPGASVIVNHTRWHEDDVIGRLLSNTDDPVRSVSLQAINASGEALWPARRPLEWLQKMHARIGDYDWESLYQQNPRPRGAKVFRDAHFYTERPARMRVSIGVDCAYTASTRADRSVAVVLGECESLFYVLQVWSDQVEAPAFARILRGLTIAWPGAPMLWYGAGPEKGIADYLNDEGVPLLFESATTDKFVRAQPAAGAWNRGDILIPGEDLERGIRTPEWVQDFMGVVLGFTGVKDLRDDEVDALAAAYDLLAGGMGIVQTSARGERSMLNTGGF